MPAKNTVTSSIRSVKPRLSNAERRAAEIAAGAGKQAQLKHEAAERRAERARREAESPPQPRKVPSHHDLARTDFQ
jgi:hypothetical protein